MIPISFLAKSLRANNISGAISLWAAVGALALVVATAGFIYYLLSFIHVSGLSPVEETNRSASRLKPRFPIETTAPEVEKTPIKNKTGNEEVKKDPSDSAQEEAAKAAVNLTVTHALQSPPTPNSFS